MALNPQQLLFIKEYLIDSNATRAAVAAGYSPRTATQQASRLLTLVNVRDAIEAAQLEQTKHIEKRAAKKLITKERVLERLAQIGFANLRDFVTISERGTVKLMPTSTRKRQQDYAIKKISQSSTQHGGSDSLELHDPVRALELISRMCGWITDKHEVSGKDGAPLTVTVKIVDGKRD